MTTYTVPVDYASSGAPFSFYGNIEWPYNFNTDVTAEDMEGYSGFSADYSVYSIYDTYEDWLSSSRSPDTPLYSLTLDAGLESDDTLYAGALGFYETGGGNDSIVVGAPPGKVSHIDLDDTTYFIGPVFMGDGDDTLQAEAVEIYHFFTSNSYTTMTFLGEFYGGGGDDVIYDGDGWMSAADGYTFTEVFAGHSSVGGTRGYVTTDGSSASTAGSYIEGDGADDFDVTFTGGNTTAHFALGAATTDPGDDTIYGYGGDDTLMGQGGDDHLYGGDHSDSINGGDGNDFISGGDRGSGWGDTVTGGAGADFFVVSYEPVSDEDGEDDEPSFWGNYIGSFGDEVGGEIASDVVKDTMKENAAHFAKVGASELGTFAKVVMTIGESSLLLPVLTTGASVLVDSFIEMLTESNTPPKTPSDRFDVLTITDFNPSEDVIAIPSPTGLESEATFSTVIKNISLPGVLSSQWGYELQINDVTYAQVAISSDFWSEIGLSPLYPTSGQQNPNSSVQYQLLTEMLGQGVAFNPDGTPVTQISGDILPQFMPSEDGDGGEGDADEGGLPLFMLGAFAPAVRVGASNGSPSNQLVTGTMYGDILTNNPTIVAPELWSANGFSADPDTSNNVQQIKLTADKAATIYGLDGDDIIYGTEHADNLHGGSGDDEIYTFSNISSFDGESVFGEDGDDIVYTGNGNNGVPAAGFPTGTFNGGTGTDTLQFFYGSMLHQYAVVISADKDAMLGTLASDAPAGATVFAYEADPGLIAGTTFASAASSYAFAQFEAFVGGPMNDHLTGIGSGLSFGGGMGDDTLVSTGAGPGDTLEGGLGADVITGYSGGGTTVTYASAQDDALDIAAAMLPAPNPDDVSISDNPVADLADDLMVFAAINVTGDTATGVIQAYDTTDASQSILAPSFTDQNAGGDTNFDTITQVSTIVGSTNADLFVLSGQSNIVLDGGDGADRFVLNPSIGGTTGSITNFDGDEDILDLTAFTWLTAEDVVITDTSVATAASVPANRAFSLAIDFSQGGLQLDFYDPATGTTLDGLEDDEVLEGGIGPDTVTGNGGDDTIYGQQGPDQLAGNRGDDSISGSVGHDTVTGGMGDDTVTGEGGNDSIHGGGGADSLAGNHGSDTVIGAAGQDTVDGGAGDDTAFGGAGADSVTGGSGNDSVYGNNGDDSLNGGSGNDTVHGGAGDDTATGGLGADTVAGFTGDDSIMGAGGDDFLMGGSGNDTLGGGTGNDTLLGAAGNDVLSGKAGDDLVVGGAGDDTLTAGTGSDTLTGGDGADTFIAGLGGTDVITDFDVDTDFLDGLTTAELDAASSSGSVTTITTGAGEIILQGVDQTDFAVYAERAMAMDVDVFV